MVGAAIRGQYAYCPDEQGLKVLDIADPTRPRLVGRVGIAVQGTSASGYVRLGITLKGKFALVGAGRMGLEVFEIADPQAPRLLETYPTAGFAQRSICTATHLYLGDGEGGIQIFRHGLGEG